MKRFVAVLRLGNGDVRLLFHQRLELGADEVARGKDHVACDEGDVLVRCGIDGRVHASQRTALVVLVGDEANLSKFDQIVEKIKVFGLVGGDDELVCQWEKAIDSTPDKWLAQEGNRRLAASHTPGFATRLQNDGQITAFAHEPSAHLDARQATSGHVRIM